jgi:hypothetical protein
MIVTSEPNRLKTEANSTPTAPAPSTTIDFGTWSKSSSWSLVTTRGE